MLSFASLRRHTPGDSGGVYMKGHMNASSMPESLCACVMQMTAMTGICTQRVLVL